MRTNVLFYLPCNKWAGLKQREQHICEKLSASYRIYYCEISPIAKKSLAFLKTENYSIKEKKVNKGLTILEIPCVLSSENLQKYSLFRSWNEHQMQRAIAGVVDKYKGSNSPIIGVGHPRYPFRSLNGAVKYFDCMDNMPAFYGDRWMLYRYREIEQSADAIFISTKELGGLFPSRKDLLVVQNGVNPSDFSLSSNRRPSDMPHGKPIVGYYGTISDWFDFETVKRAAQQCREFNFVLIGPTHCDESVLAELLRESNIYWLGQKPYALLKSYLAFFDIALIPFRLNELTRFVNPTKLYEYLCLGKPVLTTPLPPLLQYHPHIMIYSDLREFISALKILHSRPPDRRLLRRIALANTWRDRARQIDDVLHGLMQRKKI